MDNLKQTNENDWTADPTRDTIRIDERGHIILSRDQRSLTTHEIDLTEMLAVVAVQVPATTSETPARRARRAVIAEVESLIDFCATNKTGLTRQELLNIGAMMEKAARLQIEATKESSDG